MPVTRPPSSSTSSTVKPSRTSAPASPAASTSSRSRTVRRGLYIASTPWKAGKRPSSTTSPVSNLTARVGGAPEATTRSSSPQRRSLATAGRCTWWLERVSLGKLARSTTSTLQPPRASSIAVDEPATRAPTTITSYMGRSPSWSTQVDREAPERRQIPPDRARSAREGYSSQVVSPAGV
jgi:hypothetical protein